MCLSDEKYFKDKVETYANPYFLHFSQLYMLSPVATTDVKQLFRKR